MVKTFKNYIRLSNLVRASFLVVTFDTVLTTRKTGPNWARPTSELGKKLAGTKVLFKTTSGTLKVVIREPILLAWWVSRAFSINFIFIQVVTSSSITSSLVVIEFLKAVFRVKVRLHTSIARFRLTILQVK